MYRADLKALKTPGLVQDFDKQTQGVFKDYIKGSGGYLSRSGDTGKGHYLGVLFS